MNPPSSTSSPSAGPHTAPAPNVPSAPASPAAPAAGWDTGSNDDFFRYYEQQSRSPAALASFRRNARTLCRLAGDRGRPLEVADIGCGAGAQALVWNELGHRYRGLDINRPLLDLARQRAAEQGLEAVFEIGSATALPWPAASVDVCMLPFLLEHVVDWEAAVAEALRVLRPGGLVLIGTTNKLCPVQDEFNLPGYSWYPPPLKRYFERRAVTDWPAVANHAKYPAVHWFSVDQLGRHLRAHGCTEVFDRFDLVSDDEVGRAGRLALRLLRHFPPARFAGHVLTPYTLVVGRKAG